MGSSDDNILVILDITVLNFHYFQFSNTMAFRVFTGRYASHVVFVNSPLERSESDH